MKEPLNDILINFLVIVDALYYDLNTSEMVVEAYSRLMEVYTRAGEPYGHSRDGLIKYLISRDIHGVSMSEASIVVALNLMDRVISGHLMS